MKPFKLSLLPQVFVVVLVCGMRQKDAKGDRDALKQRILLFYFSKAWPFVVILNVTLHK